MDWVEGRERLRAPIFAPLRSIIDRLPGARWPNHAELTEAAAGLATAQGKALKFVMPRAGPQRPRRHYEVRIAQTGEIETRLGNWHDLFNALVWNAFPQAKGAINAQHAAILAERGAQEARRRSPERDALTLFDEGGVIVVSSSPELLRLIVDFAWKQLFWHRRAQLRAKARFFAFGHALYEKALDPFLGIVAKTVLVAVEESFFASPLDAQVRHADERLARHFASRARFHSPKTMAPLPVLGVPGWHPGNGCETFYDDPIHFAPRRSELPRVGAPALDLELAAGSVK